MHRAFSGIPAGAVRVSPSRRTSPFIPVRLMTAPA